MIYWIFHVQIGDWRSKSVFWIVCLSRCSQNGDFRRFKTKAPIPEAHGMFAVAFEFKFRIFGPDAEDFCGFEPCEVTTWSTRRWSYLGHALGSLIGNAFSRRLMRTQSESSRPFSRPQSLLLYVYYAIFVSRTVLKLQKYILSTD